MHCKFILVILFGVTSLVRATVMPCGDSSTRNDEIKCKNFNGGGLCVYDYTTEPRCRVDVNAKRLGMYIRKATDQLWIPEKPQNFEPVRIAAMKYADERHDAQMKIKVAMSSQNMGIQNHNDDFPQCLVDVPMCHRSACGDYSAQKNATHCLSDPTCCFDKDLFIYRHTYGDDFMKDAPTCYYGPTSITYQKLVATVEPWSPWYSALLLNMFLIPLKALLKDAFGEDACPSENSNIIPKICGWGNITETECKLKSCCFTRRGVCVYPTSEAMKSFQTKSTFPELHSDDTDNTKCSADVFASPKIFNRLSCQNLDTSDPYSILKCHKDCCMDKYSFHPALQSRGMLYRYQPPTRPPTRAPRTKPPPTPPPGIYHMNPNPYGTKPNNPRQIPFSQGGGFPFVSHNSARFPSSGGLLPKFPLQAPVQFPIPPAGSGNQDIPPELAQLLGQIGQSPMNGGVQGMNTRFTGMQSGSMASNIPPPLQSMFVALNEMPPVIGGDYSSPPQFPGPKNVGSGRLPPELIQLMMGLGDPSRQNILPVSGMNFGQFDDYSYGNQFASRSLNPERRSGSIYNDEQFMHMLIGMSQAKLPMVPGMDPSFLLNMVNPSLGDGGESQEDIDFQTLLSLGMLPGIPGIAGSYPGMNHLLSMGSPKSVNPMVLYSLMNKNGGKLDLSMLLQMGLLPGANQGGSMGKLSQMLLLSKLLNNSTNSNAINQKHLTLLLILAQQHQQQRQRYVNQNGPQPQQKGQNQNHYSSGYGHNNNQHSNNYGLRPQTQNQPSNFYQQSTTMPPHYRPPLTPTHYNGKSHQNPLPGMQYQSPQPKSAGDSDHRAYLQSLLSGTDDGPLNFGNVYCPYSFHKISGFPDLSHSVRGCCKVTPCYHRKQYNHKPIVTLQPPSFGPWSEWTSCSQTCDTDEKKYRTRECVKEGRSGGACQGKSFEIAKCSSGPCTTTHSSPTMSTQTTPLFAMGMPEDKMLQQFLQSMSGMTPPVGNIPTPDAETSTPLNMESNNQPNPKPQFATYSQWGEWTQCDRTCEGGVMYRERICKNVGFQPPYDQCFGTSRESKVCAIQPCFPAPSVSNPPPYSSTGPPHTIPSLPSSTTAAPMKTSTYGFSAWTSWSECQEKKGQEECTGMGVQVRTRKCYETFDGLSFKPVIPQTICGVHKIRSTQNCPVACFPDLPVLERKLPSPRANKKEDDDEREGHHENNKEEQEEEIDDGEWGIYGECEDRNKSIKLKCGEIGVKTKTKTCTALSDLCHTIGEKVYKSTSCIKRCRTE